MAKTGPTIEDHLNAFCKDSDSYIEGPRTGRSRV